MAGFAFAMVEINLKYGVADAFNNDIFAIGAVGTFGFVTGDIADIGKINTFLDSYFSALFKSRYRS